MAQNRQLATPAYLVALALIVIPPFDSLMQVLPFRLGQARWRFGAFGLFSNALILPLVGILIAFVIATLLEHHRFRRVIGVFTGFAVVILAASWVVFGLDVLQVRGEINPAAALAFKVASTTAAAKSLFAMVTLAAFTIASFRLSKKAPVVKTQRSAGGMVVGGRTAASPAGAPREIAPVPTAEQ